MRQPMGHDRLWPVLAMVFGMLLATVPGLPAQDAAGPGERLEMPAGAEMVRGTVTTSSADGLTVKAAAGEVYQVTVTPNTRLMKARQPVKLAEIKAGDGVGAVGVLDASKTLHAVFVTVVDAEQVKRAQAELGRSYIVGEVTAINDLRLTIKRADGAMQTIAVDEGTSFRRGGRWMGMGGGGGEAVESGGGQRGSSGSPSTPRRGEGAGGGESITLADLKAGDSVVGRGTLKDGVFVPTELRVMEAGARQRRRGGEMRGVGEAGGTAPTATPPMPPKGVHP